MSFFSTNITFPKAPLPITFKILNESIVTFSAPYNILTVYLFFSSYLLIFRFPAAASANAGRSKPMTKRVAQDGRLDAQAAKGGGTVLAAEHGCKHSDGPQQHSPLVLVCASRGSQPLALQRAAVAPWVPFQR